MMGTEGIGSADLSELAHLEGRLAATLTAAGDELAHAESFDPEQRAEIYAILEALQTDTAAHRLLVEALERKLTRRPADA